MDSWTVSEGAATPPAERPAQQTDACAVVWFCWLVLTAAAFFFLAHYAPNMPYMDEYDRLLPWLTHDQPVNFDYFWSQANEHRIPVPKLILFGLAKMTHMDFRAGMYFSVVIMSALAAGMLLIARALRGYTSYVDAVIPLLLLHWGHYENFLMGMLLAFPLATFVACIVLALVVNRGSWGVLRDGQLRIGAALLMGLCLVALPLCGAQGTVFAPPLALWLGYLCLRSLLSSQYRDWRALLVLPLPVLACGVIGVYFLVGYQAVPGVPLCTDLKKMLGTAAEFLFVGFGTAAKTCWPYGTIGLIVCAITVLSALVWSWENRKAERLPILGISAFLLGAVALAVAVGHGRGAFAGGFSSRYGLMSVPFILALYLAPLRFGLPAGARVVQGCILFFAVLLAMPNFSEGRNVGRERRHHYQRIQAAIRAGKSPQEAAFSGDPFFYFSPVVLAQGLERMQKVHAGPYAR